MPNKFNFEKDDGYVVRAFKEGDETKC